MSKDIQETINEIVNRNWRRDDEVSLAKEITNLFQSQADQYEREKGEMVREVLQEVHEAVYSETVLNKIKSIAQKYGVDLSE